MPIDAAMNAAIKIKLARWLKWKLQAVLQLRVHGKVELTAQRPPHPLHLNQTRLL